MTLREARGRIAYLGPIWLLTLAVSAALYLFLGVDAKPAATGYAVFWTAWLALHFFFSTTVRDDVRRRLREREERSRPASAGDVSEVDV